MPGIGGSSPPPSNVSYTGAQPQLYTPQAQQGADQAYQNLVNQLYNQGLGGIQSMGSGTPASNYWPQVQGLTSQLTNNPYAGQAQGTSNTVAGLGATQGQSDIDVGQWMRQQGLDLTNMGQGLAAENAPLYQAGAGLMAQAPIDFAAGQGLINNVAPNLYAEAGPTFAAGQQVWNTANDPQQELYNTDLHKIQEQAGAANAASGVAGPYAAGMIDDATSNFQLGWENQQLGRQQQGASALDAAALASGNLYGQGANITGQGASIIGQGGNLEAQGAGIIGQGANIATQGGNLINQGVGAAGQGAALQGTGINEIAQTGAMPYATSTGQAQTGMNAINSAIGAGNNAFNLPQATLNNLQSYLQLGQSAGSQALAASQLGGNQQMQQANLLGQGVGGLASLATLGGPQGLGLYGSGAGAGAGAAASGIGASALPNAVGDVGALSDAQLSGLAATDTAAGGIGAGSSIFSNLPLVGALSG